MAVNTTPDQGGTGSTWKLFGFTITRGEQPTSNGGIATNQTQNTQPSFALPQSDDGAIVLQTGAYFGTYVDLEGVVRNEVELITRYREMAMQPEMETALDDITNEAIITNDQGISVEIVTDNLKTTKEVKDRIREEFRNIQRMLDFGNMGHDIFRRWYVDGRIFYHMIIDNEAPADGVKEIRYIDPRRIRKIREIQKTKDSRTGAEIITNIQEYYLYNERGVIGAHSNLGTRISPDSVVNVNSGLMDSRRAMVLSYLHKAIKPLNQLRMVEDATVIYRMSRAPERRVFYIDVGNLPKTKAEQYIHDIMVKYRNKLTYDSSTGEIRDDRKHLSMLEDFWLPRREGGRGTEIQTLPGGVNLGELEDVKYFQRKLYQSLSVPISRLDQQQQGISFGRLAEVTRDELKFSKFVQRLRNRFSILFDDILRVQLSLKGICTTEEWMRLREDIWYDYLKDNNFNELKEAELLSNRLSLLATVDPYLGRFFSLRWVKRNVLQQTDEQIEEMDAEMEDEKNRLGALAGPMGGAGMVDPLTGEPLETSDAEGGPENDGADPAMSLDDKMGQLAGPKASGATDKKAKNLKMEGTFPLNTIKRIARESSNSEKVVI